MTVRTLVLITLIFITNVGFPGSLRADSLRVVASIKPVHSLVAAVMHGVGEPALLIDGGGSAHSYALRPSEVRRLSRADLVFWVGPDFETFLQKPLIALAPEALSVALMDRPPVMALLGRAGGLLSAHDSDADQEHAHAHARDGHIWLDPLNAVAMVEVISASLQKADPVNAKTYSDNAMATIAALKKLDSELRDQLQLAQTKPSVVFHDAFQYFEKRYGLNVVGFVVTTPEQMTSAKRVVEMKTAIKQLRPVCIYSEPFVEPDLMKVYIEGSDLKLGILDPEGATLPSGRELYFQLMRKLAYDFTSCLS